MKKKETKSYEEIKSYEYNLVFNYFKELNKLFEASLHLGTKRLRDRPIFVLEGMKKILTELGYNYDHTATVRAYHVNSFIGYPEKYNGRFGFGYCLSGFPTRSNRFSEIIYFTKQEEK